MNLDDLNFILSGIVQQSQDLFNIKSNTLEEGNFYMCSSTNEIYVYDKNTFVHIGNVDATVNLDCDLPFKIR